MALAVQGPLPLPVRGGCVCLAGLSVMEPRVIPVEYVQLVVIGYDRWMCVQESRTRTGGAGN